MSSQNIALPMPVPVFNASQPSTTSMDVYNTDEKTATHQHGHGCSACELEGNSPCHKRCHGARIMRFLLPILLVFLGLVALLGASCYIHFDPFGFTDGRAIFSRAVDDSTSGNSFTDNKLYLIVIFVGLLVVILLGICLSAWCCKGSFENPLCCPCYLCACCGGLACLECIGCGLCAAGIDEM